MTEAIGHNSGEAFGGPERVGSGHLRAFIERVERLEEEKRAIADDIKQVYIEAKSVGFDPKIMRKVVSLRRMDRDRRIEEERLVELYLDALGDLAGTPLGQSAIARARR